jgi:uncharacterized protein (TIGR02996 family)
MSIYNTPEFQSFILAMRENPEDRVTPLVAADFLTEMGKQDHGDFIRACVRYRELRDQIQELSSRDAHWSEKEPPMHERRDLISAFRSYINRYCHEWSGGAIRSFVNPTIYDWDCGFIRHWSFCPLKTDSDRGYDENVGRKIASLVRRQPIVRIGLVIPVNTWETSTAILKFVSSQHPGVEFCCGDLVMKMPIRPLKDVVI